MPAPAISWRSGTWTPGNWATDLAGGARFGYTLLSVILVSNLLAVLLQALAAKLGIATGRDLAQACRDHYSRRDRVALWLLAEIAITACDLAEVIGSAIALNLLFHIPLAVGVCITAARCVRRALPPAARLPAARGRGHHADRDHRAGVPVRVGAVPSRPAGAVARGFIPTTAILTDSAMLYIAISILGATVMPHNLYLHSSIVQTRRYDETPPGKREAVRYAVLDSTVALTFALFINAAILIVAAATFHTSGHAGCRRDPGRVQAADAAAGRGRREPGVRARAARVRAELDAHRHAGRPDRDGRISQHPAAPVDPPPDHPRSSRSCRLASSRSSTAHRAPAKLLILSQVILSLQLSFAVVPLVQFTSDRAKMGELANPRWLRVAELGRRRSHRSCSTRGSSCCWRVPARERH